MSKFLLKRLLAAILVTILSSISAYQPAYAQSTCDPFAVIGLVSIDTEGSVVGGFVYDEQSVSEDGRYIVFGVHPSEIYFHDRLTCDTHMVSVNSAGEPSNDNALVGQSLAVISENGDHVAFGSNATNLVANDTNTCPGGTQPGRCADIFVRDIQASQTVRVSVASNGVQANNSSFEPTISANGRYIAFLSFASNLISGDTNGAGDIFVHDRDSDGDGIFDESDSIRTTRVSISSSGAQSNGTSGNPYISPDGRYVAFDSNASNLVSGDTNGSGDIFIYDRQVSQTTRISLGVGGTQANGLSMIPSLSANGNIVLFYSEARNLVSGDNNNQMDIFVVNRRTGYTTRIPNYLGRATISRNGRFVAFSSYTPDLVPDDTNICVGFQSPTGACPDIFVRDLITGAIARVSVASDGTEANSDSLQGFLSADGRYVVFASNATNLVPGILGNEQRVYIAHNPLIPLGTPLRNNFETSTPALTWNRLSWATGYHVQVARDDDFNDIVFEDDDLPISPLEVIVNSPLGEGRYYWRVRGLTASLVGKWSATDSFTIDIP